MGTKAKPIPTGYHTVTPVLTVHGAAKLIDFLKQAFDAKETFRLPGPDGAVIHAEVKIGEVVATIDPAAAGAASAPSNSAPAPAAAKAVATESPAVRRIAAETGIHPASVAGSGKGGRVTKGDMLAAGEAKPAAAAAATPAAAPSAPTAPVVKAATPASSAERQTRKKMSPLRQKIAQRLVSAQHAHR